MVKKVKKLPNDDNSGILTLKELEKTPGFPKEIDYEKGLIAVIECDQDIPCNPCEEVCTNSAIVVGEPITNLPIFTASKCNGCLKCLSICPGLCIFAVNKNFSKKNSLIYIPYEYLPIPKKGDKVRALDRRGEFVCDAVIYKVLKLSKNKGTSIIGIIVPKEFYNILRHFEFK